MSTNLQMIVFLVGESLSGKSTLQNYLKNYDIDIILSTTTREPREGEVQGKDYNFVSVQDMTKYIFEDKCVQYLEFGDNYYGTLLESYMIDSNIGTISVLPAEMKKIKTKFKELDIDLEYTTLFYNLSDDQLLKNGESSNLSKEESQKRIGRGTIRKDFIFDLSSKGFCDYLEITDEIFNKENFFEHCKKYVQMEYYKKVVERFV